MKKRPFHLIFVIGLLIIIALLFLLLYSGPRDSLQPGSAGKVYLLYTSSGSMVQLLNAGQIDAFIVWEPVVSTAILPGTAKMIATPEYMPPPGEWGDTACCVLVLRNDMITKNPDVSALLSALTTAAVEQVNENQSLAENITARWVFGTKPLLTATGTLDPVTVEQQAFTNINFTSSSYPPDIDEIGLQGEQTSTKVSRMNSTVVERGKQYLNGTLPLPETGSLIVVNLGYLPSSDHTAPLYAMVQESDFFCERYGFCLAPDNPAEQRPEHCTLFVNDQPFATVNLIPGQSGGGIMTTVGQGALDGAYIGSVPVELQIGLGNPATIIQSINSGGTGLVVRTEAPCDDWVTFTEWADTRSAEGRPLVIATVQSSIQESIIRSALAYDNITVIMYGT
jgi:ABC-type nitrate/sulfonate/bicarbonate transport system substrate-binding protein